MTSLQAILAFTAAAALLTITPGLDTALVLRTAAVEGPRRAFLAGLGICLGCLLWGLAASAGLGALLVVSRMAFNVVRILGAGYLLYLGFQLLLRSSRRLAGTLRVSAARLTEVPMGTEPLVSTTDVSARVWFVRGLLTNLLNPKVGVFYLTFLPQFVPATVPVTLFSMLLATIHAAEGLLWFGFLIGLTRPLSAWLSRPAVVTTLDRATGLLLIGFGVRLVFSRSR